ncbi:TonB family protein [Hymenobacter pini]|uniref:TonB family protein n=1 Tax=Hymenobacter pini TaxID=2880879 RepID=UPI001CF4743C|nr:TonB family protein [Hymenobacter pini]MCA8832919.1 TonB family protein [Hymenobacter pini]
MPRPNLTSAPSATAGAHLPVELLRRYVAGELPPAEEHAVEAHTLDCAVCADILEGLEMQPAAAHDASMQELRQRLNARVRELTTEAAPEPRVIPLWAWRPLAAAAVLLLLLGVVGWLTISRLNNAPEVASRPVPEASRRAEPATVRPAEPVAAVDAPEVATVTPAAPASPIRRSVLAARYRRPVAVPRGVPSQDPPADLAGLEAAGNGSVAAADVATPATEPAAVSMSAPAETAENYKEAAAAPVPKPAAAKTKMARVASAPAAASAPASNPLRTVQGRVTDTAGQPLPGATVTVPGTQQGAVTGSDGSFAITVPAATEQLTVNFIGYASKTQPLRPSDSTLALALAPDTKQLSEVVVVRREAPPMLPSISATPAGGYGKLRKYLTDSLDYPEKALTDRREGTVRVQFVVGADGKLSDFKVVKSVSPECDEEALRLLREGPAWFPAVQNGRRTARKVVVSVPFKIEQR